MAEPATAAPEAAAAQRRAQRRVLVLSALFGLSGMAGVMVVAVASVAALGLAPREGLATLPVSLGLLGGLCATVPASRAMARWGRRPVFSAATWLALLGAAVAAWGIARSDFTAMCAGSLLLGTLGGVAPFYRFAAVDLMPSARARAIGLVLGAGVASGVLGPLAAAWAADFHPERYTGTYLVIVLLAAVVLLLLPLARFAPPPPPGQTMQRTRFDAAFARAVAMSVAAYAAMVLTMVAAPLGLKAHGHGLDATAFVIQAHVVAMFLPSFLTGRLVERVGPDRVAALGIVGLAACVAVNLLGASVAHTWTALVLLGLGWNLLYVAGSATLAAAHAGPSGAKVQGVHDLLAAGTAAAAAFAAGPLWAALGWGGLNWTVAGILALAAVALAGPLRLRKPAAAPTA